MSVGVKKIEVLAVDLPLKKVFRHALHVRQASESVFVKIYLESGATGYGESLPRKYVTNETTGSVFEKLRKVLPHKLIGAKFSGLKDVPQFISSLKELEGAARCCVEIALLDAVGRHFNEPISKITGNPVRNNLFAAGIVSADAAPRVVKKTLAIKIFGFRSTKVKVGLGDDLKRLKIVRKMLGDKADIRIDANCAWSPEEAIEKINQMSPLGITAVEQPVAADDFQGLKKVTDSVQEAIIADESLRTIKDAERLSRLKACNMFNIRISKCGGISNALKIADIARRNKIKYEVGCQVGESGVLTAAGRHLACGIDNVEYYEGSYGRFLLKQDVTRENMTMGIGGRVTSITGPGLGISVKDEVLDRYTVNRFTIG